MCISASFLHPGKDPKQFQNFIPLEGKEISEKAMTLTSYKSVKFEDPFRESVILTAFSGLETEELVISVLKNITD